MKTDKGCTCESMHGGHICELELKGEMDTIRKITSDPVVSCMLCGAEANSSDSVCSAVEIFSSFKHEPVRTDESDNAEMIMEPDFLCQCPAEHETHLCRLKKEGNLQEMKAMSKEPVVSCLLCEELADSADHVCSPVEL